MWVREGGSTSVSTMKDKTLVKLETIFKKVHFNELFHLFHINFLNKKKSAGFKIQHWFGGVAH